jgi:type IV pilus assembly protein PilC
VPDAAVFEFVALDAAGERRTGLMTAIGEDDVVEKVRRMGLRPVRVDPKRADLLHTELHLPFAGAIGAKRKVRNDLAVFSRQLATMVSAGLPLLRCLTTLAAQSTNPILGPILARIADDVSGGERLSTAMARHGEWFDAFYISMVQAGEASGDIDTVLVQLAETAEKTAELRRKVRSALTYPVAIAALAGFIVLGMLLFLVPSMAKIFEGLGGTLPLPTRIVIALSKPLTAMVPFAGGAPLTSSLLRGLLAVAAVIAIKRTFRRWRATEAGRLALDGAKLKVPVFGDLLAKTALARFSRSMAVLTRAGIPILDALRISEAVVANAVLARSTAQTADDVTAGLPLGVALAGRGTFPPMITQMVMVGEDTGELDLMLTKVAEFYESEVSSKVDALTALLEPVMLVFMGLVIGGMVIALYLPMFKVITLIK